MTNLLRKYKNWTEKQNRKYYDDYTEYFQPYFRWNPFDDRNDDKLKGTGLNAILKELEGIFDVSYYSRKQK